MSNNPYEDDPILTAYALGELESEEASEVEARLADDAGARDYVEEVRRTAERLSAALRAEPAPAAGPDNSEMSGRRWPWHRALAMAASVAVVGLIAAYLAMPEMNRARDARGPVVALAERETADEAPEAGTELRTDASRSGAAQRPPMGVHTKGGETNALHLEQSDLAQKANPSQPQTAEGLGVEGQGQSGQAPPSQTAKTPPATEAARREVAGDHERREVIAGLEQDRQQALADGNTAAADNIRRQMDSLEPASTAAREKTLQSAGGAGGEVAPPADGVYRRERASAFTPGNGLITGVPREDDGGGFGGGGRFRDDFNTEQYDRVVDNEFKRVADQPLSTFSVDVDTASYSNTRRFLNGGQLPPPDAVRIEELVNYFDYNYPPPSTDSQHPFSAAVAVADAPWNPQHRLVRIGIKGKEIPQAERPASNLVFLIDVSGSMQPENKLPLVKRSMKMLAEQLDERDRVAIVVYAGSSGLVLPSTSGAQRDHITGALARLDAGGSTNGGEGIQLAYDVAKQNFIKGGVNRVILCTDGDFNIGVTDRGQLTRLIEEQAKTGVYLSVLGFGMGNLKDATMEDLTNKGEGNYGYIDTEHEARKLLVEQLQGTLQAIAKDVKIQVEFNPAEVGSYRLIGYENRILAKEDFNDDTKDAGDIGAGHEVTALYEVVPVEVQAKTNESRLAQLRELEKKYLEIQVVAGQPPDGRPPHEAELAAVRAEIEALTKNQLAPPVDDLKYQEQPAVAPAAASGELLTVKLRYKGPEAPKEQGTSSLVEFPVKDEPRPFAETDQDFQLAAGVAGFGMLLRDSPYKGTLTWAGLEEMIRALEMQPKADPGPNAPQASETERRREFRDLVQKAAALPRTP